MLNLRKANLQLHVLQLLWQFKSVNNKRQGYCLTRIGSGINVVPAVTKVIVDTVQAKDQFNTDHFSLNSWYIIIISSSCRAISTDIPDPLSPPLPIVYLFQQVIRATPCILKELLYAVRPGRPALAPPYEGVHRSTSLMSSKEYFANSGPTCKDSKRLENNAHVLGLANFEELDTIYQKCRNTKRLWNCEKFFFPCLKIFRNFSCL